jgi:hypothetical protein
MPHNYSAFSSSPLSDSSLLAHGCEFLDMLIFISNFGGTLFVVNLVCECEIELVVL